MLSYLPCSIPYPLLIYAVFSLPIPFLSFHGLREIPINRIDSSVFPTYITISSLVALYI